MTIYQSIDVEKGNTMTGFLKSITSSAAVLVGAAFLGTATPLPAAAGEYCRQDLSNMMSCGFATMEQCQATSSGRGGTCMRDPYLAPANSPENAYASTRKGVQRVVNKSISAR